MTRRQLLFHVEEYKSLRAEVLDALGRSDAIFLAAVAAAATLAAWSLVSSSRIQRRAEGRLLLELTWWLPLLTTLCAGALGFAQYRRVKLIGCQLARLEHALGAPTLAWEPTLATSPWDLLAGYGFAWGVLLLSTLVFACVMMIHGPGESAPLTR